MMTEELVPSILQSEEEETTTRPQPFRILAVVQEADKPNKNRRVYPRKVLQQQVDRMQEYIKNRSLMGELGTPKEAMIHFAKASHLVIDLFMSDDKLMAEIEVLDTPSGRELRQLLSAGLQIGFRMSGVGGGKEEKGYFVVDESYKLIQIFACNDPA